jgi:hypothetical protein
MTPEETIEVAAANYRGVFIHYFTRIEILMDCLIRNKAFGDEESYNKFAKILSLTMDRKMELYKICIDNYQKENGGDYSFMISSLKELVNIRHILAHWMLDTSSEGVSLYEKNQTLRFIKSNRDANPQVFTNDVLRKRIVQIGGLNKDMLKIHDATDSGK